MKEYYFLIRDDGSMVRARGGPLVYHSIKTLKYYGPDQLGYLWGTPKVRILHMWIDKGTAHTQWIGWAELDEYN